MNKLLTLFLITGFTANSFLLGFSATTQSKGFTSEWQNGEMIGCKTYNGVSADCTIDERNMMVSLKKLYNN